MGVNTAGNARQSPACNAQPNATNTLYGGGRRQGADMWAHLGTTNLLGGVLVRLFRRLGASPLEGCVLLDAWRLAVVGVRALHAIVLQVLLRAPTAKNGGERLPRRAENCTPQPLRLP